MSVSFNFPPDISARFTALLFSAADVDAFDEVLLHADIQKDEREHRNKRGGALGVVVAVPFAEHSRQFGERELQVPERLIVIQIHELRRIAVVAAHEREQKLREDRRLAERQRDGKEQPHRARAVDLRRFHDLVGQRAVVIGAQKEDGAGAAEQPGDDDRQKPARSPDPADVHIEQISDEPERPERQHHREHVRKEEYLSARETEFGIHKGDQSRNKQRNHRGNERLPHRIEEPDKQRRHSVHGVGIEREDKFIPLRRPFIGKQMEFACPYLVIGHKRCAEDDEEGNEQDERIEYQRNISDEFCNGKTLFCLHLANRFFHITDPPTKECACG